MKFPQNKYFKYAIFSLLTVVLLGAAFYGSVYLGLWGPIPSKKQLEEIKQSEATEVLTSDGKLLGKYYFYDRQPVPYEELPKHLIEALIATEDVRFFEHNGIDEQSLFRVFFKTILMQDASSGGGSTITLQLAKNLFGRKDLKKRGIVVTKLRESIVARRLEKLYTKEEILELYFNTVPFSDNTYGIESASRKFFNKPATELDLAEAATLVGTLKASNFYNPRRYPERSKQRRNIVLSQMEKYHYLQPEVAAEAKKDTLMLDYQHFNHDKGIATYFREYVRKEAVKVLDSLQEQTGKTFDIYHDGLKIYTTLDYRMQEYAEEALLDHMASLQKEFENSWGRDAAWLKNKKLIQSEIEKTGIYRSLKKLGYSEQDIMDSLEVRTVKSFFDYGKTTEIEASIIDSIKHYMKFLNAGMISIEPGTGAVKTWVGGVDFPSFKFDHVSQSKRQAGSVFKPIVYAAALENGVSPCSYYSLQETTYDGGYTPSNSSQPEDDDPYLNYSMKYALSKSVNTIAVRVMMETGIDKTVELARKMGISSELPAVPSLALGTASLSVLELAEAYTAFTNEGVPSRPYVITRIEDKEGNILVEFPAQNSGEKAFSKETGHYVLDMMQATVDIGTASRLRTTYGLNNDLAGKTGTTQNNKDGWFIGITPELTTVTWVGHDNYSIGFRSTAQGQGANSALPIFGRFYQLLDKDENFHSYTNASFPKVPESIQDQMDCDLIKRDGFLKRLFTNPEKKREFKKKKGIFSWLKKKEDN